MHSNANAFGRRIESLRARVETLSSLRKLVGLRPGQDIAPRQWTHIELQLARAQERLLGRIERAAKEHLGQSLAASEARKLNSLLGEIEIDLSRAFTFFDTYMDVLTQRQSPELGPLLAGCDVLAWDALSRNHPALKRIEHPLVYCDRGFGASVMREGVPMPDGSPNPMPLIQIPYSRLREKYNLTSILHEAGHEAMVRLGLTKTLPQAFREALRQAGASETLQDLFALWTSEIGPDFWTFCASGVAQPTSIREILALPPGQVCHVSWTDPHPPPYLRVLLAFAWCRQTWGDGVWDGWEKEWLKLYPIDKLPRESQRVLEEGRKFLRVVSKAGLKARFRVLHGNTIPDLFDLAALSPARLAKEVSGGRMNSPAFIRLTPCMQLAVFRLARETGRYTEEQLDWAMSKWLISFGEKKV